MSARETRGKTKELCKYLSRRLKPESDKLFKSDFVEQKFELIGAKDMLSVQMKPCPDDLYMMRATTMLTKAQMPAGFFRFVLPLIYPFTVL